MGLVLKYCPRITPKFSFLCKTSTSVLAFRNARPIGRFCRRCETLGVIERNAHSADHTVDEASILAKPGIALALGGGFARGFAHLGVLKVLEQNHIPITHVAGTSVGSVFGAAYASGAPLARIMATARTIRFRDIARWNVSRLGLASNHRLGDLVERVFESKHFEDMKIPLAIVATDLATGEPVIFRQGPLVDAIRASCAFPGLFEPIQIGTRCLADGGLVAPVPTLATRQLGASLVVGVSVGLQDDEREAPKNMFQVVARAVRAAQKHQLDTWERYADLVVRPDVTGLAWDDFDRASEAIDAGAAAAQLALPRIQKLLSVAHHSAQAMVDTKLQQSWLAETLR